MLRKMLLEARLKEINANPIQIGATLKHFDRMEFSSDEDFLSWLTDTVKELDISKREEKVGAKEEVIKSIVDQIL